MGLRGPGGEADLAKWSTGRSLVRGGLPSRFEGELAGHLQITGARRVGAPRYLVIVPFYARVAPVARWVEALEQPRLKTPASGSTLNARPAERGSGDVTLKAAALEAAAFVVDYPCP